MGMFAPVIERAFAQHMGDTGLAPVKHTHVCYTYQGEKNNKYTGVKTLINQYKCQNQNH